MIENVCKEDVFDLLGKGVYVFAFDPSDNELIDLYYQKVNFIRELLKKDKHIYFLVREKEGN